MSKRKSSLNVEIRQPKTSTPIRSERPLPSPIFSESSSILHSETSSTAGDTSEFLTDTENEAVIPAAIRKISRNGKDARYFKPLMNSLYSYVLTQEIEMKSLAGLWTSKYRIKPAAATTLMMQFFVDVAGFQNCRIPDMSDRSPEDIIKELLLECPTVLSEYTYLLATNSKWSKNAILNISEFIDEIVDCAYSTRIIFKCTIFNKVLTFLKCMAECNLYPIKHTGVFIALKFCVAFGRILDQYKKELAALDPTIESGQEDITAIISEWKAKYQIISKLAHYSLKIVLSQCVNFVNESAIMHATCATEFSKLFFLLSDGVRKTNILNFIIQASIYSDVYLRYCCIKALKHILTMPNCYEADKNIPRIISTLMDRILDESPDVACEAILSMKVAVHHYSAFILPAYKSILVQCLYNKNYVIGAAAGQYFYINLKRRTNTPGELFREIAELQCVQSLALGDGLLPLYVESLVDAVEEFYHPEMLINYILQSNIPIEQEIVLVEILSHSISQILIGKSSKERNGCRKGQCDNETTERIIDEVVPKLQSLFNKYMDKHYEERCIDALLFMMGNFTYDHNSFLHHRLEMKELFKIIIKIFHKSNCESILLKISEILWKCVQDTNSLKTHSESILRTLMKDGIHMYAHLAKTTACDEEDLLLLEVTLMKLNALMRYHDVPIDWDFDFVNKLVPEDARSGHENLLCYAEKCGNSYVLMNVQTFVDENESGAPLASRKHTHQSLKAIIDKHLNMCFNNLISDSTMLKNEAFKLICKLCTDMKGFNPNEILKNLMPQLSKSQQQLIIEFLRENVFRRSANPKISGWILKMFIDTICVGGFSPVFLTNIFAYCNLFFEKYGDYYSALMKELIKNSRIFAAAIIFSTLKGEFENLLLGQAVGCGTFTDLKKLSVQLYNITPKSLCYIVTRYAISYSVKTPNGLQFLCYISCYYSNLTNEERKNISDLMEAQCSKEFLSNEVVQKFVIKMKGNSSRKGIKRDRPDK